MLGFRFWTSWMVSLATANSYGQKSQQLAIAWSQKIRPRKISNLPNYHWSMGLLTFFSPTAFRRRFRRFRRRSGRPWCRARLGSTGSGEGPGQVQQGSEEGTGRLWCRARSGSTGFRRTFRRRCGRLWCRARSGSGEGERRFQEALVVRFNGFRRRLQRRSWRRFWESLAQGQVRFNRFNRVSSAWLRSTLQKDL